jgi:hypothetical protein
MHGAVRSHSLQVRQQLIWWFCFEICKQRSLAPSFVAAGVCVISADTSSRLRHKVCTHARTSAFGLRRSLRAGSQGRRTDWKIAAHVVTEGKSPTKWNWDCWAKFSSRRHVPGSAYMTTEWDIRYSKWGPPDLSLCTGTVCGQPSPFSSPLSSVHVCWYDCVHQVMLPAKLKRYLHCTFTFSTGTS